MVLRQSEKLLEELASNQTLDTVGSSNSEAKILIKKVEIFIFTVVILVGLIGNLIFVGVFFFSSKCRLQKGLNIN
jgi:hypothetical protein